MYSILFGLEYLLDVCQCIALHMIGSADKIVADSFVRNLSGNNFTDRQHHRTLQVV